MAPNVTSAPLAPPPRPTDSHAPGRGPAAISRPPQEFQNGDVQPTGKSAPCSAASRAEDTDGEIDVDDCGDRESPGDNFITGESGNKPQWRRTIHVQRRHLVSKARETICGQKHEIRIRASPGLNGGLKVSD